MDTQSVEDNTVNVDVGEVIGNLELGLACFSEKVSNLNIFVMNLETMECELEGLVSDEENIDMDCAIKGFEFDLLCGVLGSEVRDLGLFLDTLHAEISDAKGKVSFDIWQDRLVETEQSLKLSEELFYEIKEHSVSFQRTLSSYKKEENGNVEEGGSVEEDGINLDAKNMMNMQTSEQHRNILMMLEKSLASEMDLEKNFIESKKIEENLKQRIASLEDELIQTEEEATEVWERWFEADNAREILKGISNELLARHKLSQFNLVGLRRNESELKAQLETSKEELKSDKVCSLEKQLQETESQLANVKTSAGEYQQLYNITCSQIREMDNLIIELKENVTNAENRANAAEAQCKILTETNEELNKELALLKDGGITSESIELLKRQLKECDLQLQDAVATAEASQEKQKMLYDTIEDMEHVIKDLKSKVLKAESHADSAEDKCIILSESNADLNEEVNFLRSKLECLERSLHQAEEAKMTTAKDIGKRTKFFKSLGTQLALERERVNKKLSSLVSENKILVAKLKQAYKDSSQVNANLSSDHEANRKKSSANDDEVKSDSMPDVETVRRIDAGVLTFKHPLFSIGQSGIQFGFHFSFEVAQFLPASLIPQILLLEFAIMPL
ncbi:WPP domain-interacting tail-anchored protein [Trifolium repens]|nr:WPP domain-interacting tail-anchored protein [Trifolium repens]